jgi:hypothetical protein
MLMPAEAVLMAGRPPIETRVVPTVHVPVTEGPANCTTSGSTPIAKLAVLTRKFTGTRAVAGDASPP